MVHFYLCINIHILWSNRLRANSLNNITINDLNANKPCTVKSKMNIYRGKNYKNCTHFFSGVAQTSVLDKARRVSQKMFKENQNKNQKDGDRESLYTTMLSFPTMTQSRPLPSSRCKSRKMSAVNTNLLTVLQEVKLQRGSLIRSAACCV